MKWGICSLIYHRWGFEHFLESSSKLGYTHIELNCVKDYFCHFNALQLADSPDLLLRLAAALERYRLKVSAVDCHGLVSSSADAMAYAEDYILAGFKIAHALNCPGGGDLVAGRDAAVEAVDGLVSAALPGGRRIWGAAGGGSGIRLCGG